jgi:hypothetical protein
MSEEEPYSLSPSPSSSLSSTSPGEEKSAEVTLNDNLSAEVTVSDNSSAEVTVGDSSSAELSTSPTSTAVAAKQSNNLLGLCLGLVSGVLYYALTFILVK